MSDSQSAGLTFSPFMKLVIVIISEKNESFIACRGIFALSCENFPVSIRHYVGKILQSCPRLYSKRREVSLAKRKPDPIQTSRSMTVAFNGQRDLSLIIKAKSVLRVPTINIGS